MHERNNRPGPARKRIELFCKAVGKLRVLETNLFPFPSPREASLPRELRDPRLFNYLLATLKPRVVLVYGKSAVAHLSDLTDTKLPLDAFTPIEFGGAKFDAYARRHFSYQTSDEEVRSLGSEIRRRYE